MGNTPLGTWAKLAVSAESEHSSGLLGWNQPFLHITMDINLCFSGIVFWWFSFILSKREVWSTVEASGCLTSALKHWNRQQIHNLCFWNHSAWLRSRLISKDQTSCPSYYHTALRKTIKLSCHILFSAPIHRSSPLDPILTFDPRQLLLDSEPWLDNSSEDSAHLRLPLPRYHHIGVCSRCNIPLASWTSLRQQGSRPGCRCSLAIRG